MGWISLHGVGTNWHELEKEQWPEGGVPPEHIFRVIWRWIHLNIQYGITEPTEEVV